VRRRNEGVAGIRADRGRGEAVARAERGGRGRWGGRGKGTAAVGVAAVGGLDRPEGVVGRVCAGCGRETALRLLVVGAKDGGGVLRILGRGGERGRRFGGDRSWCGLVRRLLL